MSEDTNTTQGTDEIEETEMTETPRKADLTPYDAFLVIKALNKAGVCDPKTSQEMYNMAYRWNKRSTALAYRRVGDDKWMLDGEAFAEWLKKYVSGERTTTDRRTVESMVAEYTS